MLRNYAKIAWRNLSKHKLFSFINIFGLASGMVVCMMAIIKIKEAYDYDNFHPNANSTYRVTTDFKRKAGDGSILLASTPLPLGEYLEKNYSQIDKVTRISFFSEEGISNNKDLFIHGAFADASFYQVFGFRLKTGLPAISPRSVILTEESAALFFGNENPIGQTINFGHYGDFIISGILEKPRGHSHLNFEAVASLSTLIESKHRDMLHDWTDESSAYTYVKLKDGLTNENLGAILNDVSKKVNTIFLPPQGETFQFGIQRLDRISPSKRPMYNITGEPIMTNLIVFGLLGLGMLILAFFNYVNLTLARSLDRAREVGIRKVAGAMKKQIALQFLIESIVVSSLAFFLARVELGLLSAQPIIHRLIANVPQDFTLWIYFLIFTFFTGLTAGWIPAKVFSGFQPVRVLKGKFNTRLFGGAGLRKTLMVAQFTCSLVALVVLSVFYSQSIYMAKGDYGFERKRILNIPLQGQSYEKLSTKFAGTAGVENVSASSEPFGFSGGDLRYIRRHKSDDSIKASYFAVTPSLIESMGLKIIAGNNLAPAPMRGNVRQVLINEEAARQLRFTAGEAAGQMITSNDSISWQIAGVVKDFHYSSFLRSIEPLILSNEPGQFKIISLKISAGAENNIISKLEQEWKGLGLHQPFESSWFDKELYNQHLHADDLVFLGILTAMAMSIACLGLLGMVIYTVRTRAKEVSIRRIMGAKVTQVMIVMSKDFIRLLFIAICFGLPLGFMGAQQFLQQYAYRTSISAGLLSSCALGLLSLGAITICWHVFKSAMANPVKSLRSE